MRALFIFINVVASSGALFLLAVGFSEPFQELVNIYNDSTPKPFSAWFKFIYSSLLVGSFWGVTWLWFKGSEKKFLEGIFQNTPKTITSSFNSYDTTSYLEPARLGEVLALIQVLSYDKDTSRSESGIGQELQRKPSSALNWEDLATSHPELFRVRDTEGTDKTKRIALVSRYVLPKDAEGKRPPLEPSIVNKLMELSTDIHDRQLNRQNQWKMYLPIVAAIISAGAAIVVTLLKT